MKTLRLILGDQLNQKHSWFQHKDKSVLYVMMEVGQEQEYAPHHIQNVSTFFLGMENFFNWLKAEGHSVYYIRLDEEENTHSNTENIKHILKKGSFERFEYMLPDEYRLDKQLKDLCEEIPVETSAIERKKNYRNRQHITWNI